MVVKERKLQMLEDYANRARAFKQDESKLQSEGMRQGYLKFLCPTPKDEVMFWAAYDALESEGKNENQNNYISNLEKGAYHFSPANVGVYAVNLVNDLAVLYYRAVKEFLALFKMQRKAVEAKAEPAFKGKTYRQEAQSFENTREKSNRKARAFEKSSKAKAVERVDFLEIEKQSEQMQRIAAERQKQTDDRRLQQYNESVRQRAMKKSEAAPTQEMGVAMTA